MIGRTTLKPNASSCDLFYVFVLEFISSSLKLLLRQQLVLERWASKDYRGV